MWGYTPSLQFPRFHVRAWNGMSSECCCCGSVPLMYPKMCRRAVQCDVCVVLVAGSTPYICHVVVVVVVVVVVMMMVVALLLLGTRLTTLLGNVPFLSTVVASLVTSRLDTIGRDVPDLATVEATTELRPSLVDFLPGITLEAVVVTFPRNVAGLRQGDDSEGGEREGIE